MAVKVLTDSTSYIGEKLKAELDIRTVSLSVIFKDESFREMDIDNTNFYEKMKVKGIPTSSQPTINELYSEMKSVVENGDDLVCIFLSSDMSGTYSTAHMAKDMVLETYKDARIELLDSRSNCMQLGFAVIAAAKAGKEGQPIETVVKAAEAVMMRSRFLFIPDNLEYLHKGGRIGSASALLGDLLKIIPILTVENGKTTVLTKVRTKKKAVVTMVDKMLQDILNHGLMDIVIHHINCYEEAKELALKLEERLQKTINIYDIGPVIGLHVGPGAIGIVYCTEQKLR